MSDRFEIQFQVGESVLNNVIVQNDFLWGSRGPHPSRGPGHLPIVPNGTEGPAANVEVGEYYGEYTGSRNASPAPKVSCSDCKLELVTGKWTKLLLLWMNLCVKPDREVRELASTCLVEVINRYKEDIVDDDIDRAILCTDDLEPFLRYKYPILRLRYLTEMKDLPKKMYIMMSVLFYHCCISSHTGAVENDICKYMPRDERELILKFCENLSDMEITINNVEVAIRKACEACPTPGPSKKKQVPTPHVSKVAVGSINVGGISDDMQSLVTTDPLSKKLREKKMSTLTFKASVTVMPSRISTSSFSKTSLHAESSFETSDTYSIKADEDDRTPTVDCVSVYEKDDDSCTVSTRQTDMASTNYRTDTSETRSNKYETDSIPYSETDDTSMRTIAITETSRPEKPRKVEHVLIGRSPEIKDSKIDKRREIPRRTVVKRHMVENADKNSLSESDAKNKAGEKRFKRDISETEYIKQQVMGDTSVSNEFVKCHDESCCCAVTTEDTSGDGDLSEDISAIGYKSGDTPECSACKKVRVQKKDDKVVKLKQDIRGRSRRMCTFVVKRMSVLGGSTSSTKRQIQVMNALITFGLAMTVILLFVIAITYFVTKSETIAPKEHSSGDKKVSRTIDSLIAGPRRSYKFKPQPSEGHPTWAWECSKHLCTKVYKPKNTIITYPSLSRCILLCTGPQLWPYPLGMVYFSKELVGLATDRLEYKFQAVPSDLVNQYLAEAFKLFIADLARLERIDVKGRNRSYDIEVKKMQINIEVELDGDPRIRVNTDESYYLKVIDVEDVLKISINSPSFAGVRHGLETLSQVILLDQATGALITLSEVIVKDTPSYKYRGLMLDTARNYIPLSDILRTIDGMAICKLNTFHWRITDSASFPLLLPSLSNLFEYGAYDRSMVYTKQDVKTVVNRAGVRGIRVLIEVAIPGPVGRAWAWSDDATCPKKNDNFTCDNVICLRLKMQYRVFELLQHLYSEIIDMTGVDDVFHLSDSVFSLSNCYYLIDEREGFLEKALERLRRANKGFLPKLPIIWYTQHLTRDIEAKTWERFGVQVYEWPSHPDRSLSKYKVIHSGRWDLSCDVKKQRCTKYRSWQEMYSWKSWRNIEVFSIEGGEALLWTDLVDGGNLDFHLWPRAAAVAERLWSDLIANATASGDVYIRLDNHRLEP